MKIDQYFTVDTVDYLPMTVFTLSKHHVIGFNAVHLHALL